MLRCYGYIVVQIAPAVEARRMDEASSYRIDCRVGGHTRIVQIALDYPAKLHHHEGKKKILTSHDGEREGWAQSSTTVPK